MSKFRETDPRKLGSAEAELLEPEAGGAFSQIGTHATATPVALDEDPENEIRGVWELAWPTMSAFSLQALVGFVDMLFVSKLGTHAVAGVGIGSQMHFVAFALFAAVTTGTVALVARATGSGKMRDADRFLQLSIALTMAMGAALMVVAPFSSWLISPFAVSPEVSGVGSRYLEILLYCSVPLGVGITLASAMRGAGDVRSPLLIGLLGNVLNIVGDYMLIFGNWGAPALGTDGSAIASAAAFTIATGVYFAIWLRGGLAIPRQPLLQSLPIADCRRIIRIGLPTAIEQIAFNLGIFIFLRVVTEFGTEPVAAYMIGVRILAFSFIPGIGFATAASTLVGQHLGARQPEEAAASGWRAAGGGVAVMSAIGLCIVAFAEPISDWFGAAGNETTELAVQFIYILGAAQPLMAIEFTIGGALRGAGDTRFPLFALMTGLFVFRLGSALILMIVFDAGVVAVWSCLLADYFVKAVLLSTRFRLGRWKTLEI